jgi:DNA modification methylase
LTATAEDDNTLLAEILQEQANMDYDLASLGSSQEDLDALLAMLAEDALGEMPEAGGGDDNKILVGDCTDKTQVSRLLNGSRVNMVLTDPPYGMKLDTDWSSAKGSLKSLGYLSNTTGNKYAPVIGDDADYDPKSIFEIFDYCKEIFLWGADYYAERLQRKNEGSWLVWDKRKDTQSEAIGAEFELCWSKAKHKRRMLRHDWFGFLSSSNPTEARNRLHPTQKPTSLMIDIMEQWGEKGDIVFDGYLGSGTTLIAAQKIGRKCYGFEIDCHYADTILTRFEKEFSIEPKLLERVEQPELAALEV